MSIPLRGEQGDEGLGNEKGRWERLNKKTFTEQTANGTRQHDSGARRQILMYERGYAGPRLRLRSHRRDLGGTQRNKKQVKWPRKESGDPTEVSVLGNRCQSNELKERRAPSCVRPGSEGKPLMTSIASNEHENANYMATRLTART